MFEFGILEAFIFFCGVCYLFNKNRTDDMVDVISTRLQEVYGAWRLPGYQTENPNNLPEERMSSNTLRRFGDEHRRRKAYNKEIERQEQDRMLYEIKETVTPSVLINTKPVPGLSCRHCAPSNSESQLDPTERRRDVKDILRITQHAGWRPNSSIFDWGGWCPFLAQCVRLKRMPFPQVSGTVLNDDRMRNAIDQAAKESVRDQRRNSNIISSDSDDSSDFDEDSVYTEMLKQHERRAKRLIMDMRSTISDVMLRITSWVLYKLLPCFLSGVVAHPAQVDMLKAAAAKAPGAPLIYLPLHRSHLDYILVSFILLNNDIRSPIVAAGNNLRIPFFGGLLRYLGAFFIKRKIDPIVGKKDHVYRAVLHTYVQHALAAGHNVEFFIEGGRTRTGKPCMPKSGVLSVIVDAFLDGTISDALLVPVSVNYERLVDGNFVREQLGQKKQPETFGSAISAIWHILQSRYGLMRIDFNEPFSIRELVKSFDRLGPNRDTTAPLIRSISNVSSTSGEMVKRLQHNPSSSSLYGTDIVQEEQRSLVDNIARHVVYDCASATAVMTTNAVAFLLLTRFRDGATLSVLCEALDQLRSQLEGRKDIGFTGESCDVIKYATDLLGTELIAVETRGTQLFYKPVARHESFIELSYYSNSLVPFYALESIMVTAMQTLAKEFELKFPANNFATNKEELLRKCIEHCDILRYEFILSKPCQNIEMMLTETLDRLKDSALIEQPEMLYSQHEERSRRLAVHLLDEFSDDEEDRYQARPQRVEQPITLNSDGHCDRLVLMSVLAPIGHTYLTVAESLTSLLYTVVPENDFIKECVTRIKEKVESNQCRYAESISTDTVRNCIKLLEKWGVLQLDSTEKGRQLSLTSAYDSETGVSSTIQRIQIIVP